MSGENHGTSQVSKFVMNVREVFHAIGTYLCSIVQKMYTNNTKLIQVKIIFYTLYSQCALVLVSAR